MKQTTVRSLHNAQHVKSASQSVVREVVNKTRATSLKLINDRVKNATRTESGLCGKVGSKEEEGILEI